MALGNHAGLNPVGHHPIPTIWDLHVDWSCQCGHVLGVTPWRPTRRGKPPVIGGYAYLAYMAHRADKARQARPAA